MPSPPFGLPPPLCALRPPRQYPNPLTLCQSIVAPPLGTRKHVTRETHCPRRRPPRPHGPRAWCSAAPAAGAAQPRAMHVGARALAPTPGPASPCVASPHAGPVPSLRAPRSSAPGPGARAAAAAAGGTCQWPSAPAPPRAHLLPPPPPPRRARARPSMWAAPCASAAPYLSKFLPTAPTGWMDGRALCVVPAPSIASMRHPRAAPVARRRGPRATPPSPPPRHPLGYTAPARAQAPPRAPPGAPAAARPGRAPSPPRPTTPGGPPQHCSTARADCNPRRVPPSLAKHTHLPIHTKPSPPRGASAGPLRPRCAPPARRRPASRGARQARAPPAAV
jgi:hypothetical protein